jgi:hypothetical protein
MDRDLTMQILPPFVIGKWCICGASPFGEFLDVIEPTSNTDLLGTYMPQLVSRLYLFLEKKTILLTAH